jgi:hypothetical protein
MEGHLDMRTLLALTIVSLTGVAAAQEPLTDGQIKDAIALGKSCGDIPIVRVGTGSGDFEVFIESPAGRIALQAAAARQMHQPFDVSNVTRDMAAHEYRIWLQYTLRGPRTVSVSKIVIQPKGDRTRAVIPPVREHPFQLTVGNLPAHGIVDEVRWRYFEWIFTRLPAGEFQVVLETTAGEQRYTVTDRDRARLMRVCT